MMRLYRARSKGARQERRGAKLFFVPRGTMVRCGSDLDGNWSNYCVLGRNKSQKPSEKFNGITLHKNKKKRINDRINTPRTGEQKTESPNRSKRNRGYRLTTITTR